MSYNLVFNGEVVFTISSGTQFSIAPVSSNAVLAAHLSPSDLGGLVVPLQLGQEIGPDALGYEWINDTQIAPAVGSVFAACRNIGCVGYFTGLASGYVGLCFQKAGQTYYGWIRVGAPLPGFNGGWIYDYAYETRPGTPIRAGEGTEVDQICPCDGPWKNHGDYVRQIESVASQFQRDGLITESQRNNLIKRAASSDCGRRALSVRRILGASPDDSRLGRLRGILNND